MSVVVLPVRCLASGRPGGCHPFDGQLWLVLATVRGTGTVACCAAKHAGSGQLSGWGSERLLPEIVPLGETLIEIGRASCRERGLMAECAVGADTEEKR